MQAKVFHMYISFIFGHFSLSFERAAESFTLPPAELQVLCRESGDHFLQRGRLQAQLGVDGVPAERGVQCHPMPRLV